MISRLERNRDALVAARSHLDSYLEKEIRARSPRSRSSTLRQERTNHQLRRLSKVRMHSVSKPFSYAKIRESHTFAISASREEEFTRLEVRARRRASSCEQEQPLSRYL